MSYATIPTFDLLQNGQALDGEQLTNAFRDLSEIARIFASDVLGRPCWLQGGEIDSALAGDELYGELSPGDFYVEEPASMQVMLGPSWESNPAFAAAATRVRQPTRSVLLPKSREVIVSVVPYESDARLGALRVSALDVLPPKGSSAVAWLGTGHTDIHSTVDARQHPVYGVTVEAGGDSIRSRTTWVEVTDARVAVTLYKGEQLEISIAASVTDGLVAEFQEQTRLPKSRYDMSQFALSLNGVTFDDQPPTVESDFTTSATLGWQTTVPTQRTYYVEWTIDPFDDGNARIFRTARPELGGSILVQLMMRGVAVDVNQLWMFVRVRPAERIPR